MHTDFTAPYETTPALAENTEREPLRPFAFRLGGILPLPETMPRGEDVRASVRLVSAVATALPPGARAEFRHQRTAAGEIEWTLAGAQGANDTQLSATLRCALGAAGGLFCFEGGSVGAAEELACGMVLRPRSRVLQIERRPALGFGASPGASSSELLRLPGVGSLRSPAFPSLGVILQSAPCAATARVGITRIVLEENQVAQLHALARALHQSRDTADHSLAVWLDEWTHLPCGWSMDCEVSSTEPLPEPFLQLLGGEIFGQPVEILNADEGSRCVPALDLSACRHAAGTLPRLFPAGVLLASLRKPRSYNRALPRLPENGALIGEVECQGALHPLYLPVETRDRHCWLVGATGTGKSSLLLRMIRQDVEAGEGVALIDPHGDLFEQVLASIPLNRIGDVVLLEPGRGSRVPGLNFLEVTDGPLRELQRNFVVNELFGIFDQLWDMRECGGPMFQTYFRNAVLLLMAGGSPDVTLTELPLVFEDRAYRDRLKAACSDPLVTNFWTHQAEKAGGDASLSNIAPYITSKLNIFTHSSVLRPIIGQARSTLDFRGLLSGRKIFLANLSKGLIGDKEARLLGMLLLGRIFAAGMERAVLPPHRRKPFSVFVDETQNFLTPTLAAMLAEARKFGLRLTLANQNLAQLSGQGRHDLLQALLGNVGSLALFRLGPVDARSMALYTRPAFDETMLERLPNFHAVGRILTNEGPLDPLVFRTLPPPPAGPKGVAGKVRQKQRRFTRPISQVEAEIRARRNAAPATSGVTPAEKSPRFSN